MKFLHGVAGFILLFELPIPIYWLILHPFHSFWRTRVRAAFWFAPLAAWISGGIILWHFRHALLSTANPSWFAIEGGFSLIAVEAYLFVRVERELGTRRLIGHAELTGTGEMFSSGLYAYVRHPRYAGMFSAVAGAALLAGTPTLWLVLLLWSSFALTVIRMEEKELSARFGPAYDEYRRRVPAFIPSFRRLPANP